MEFMEDYKVISWGISRGIPRAYLGEIPRGIEPLEEFLVVFLNTFLGKNQEESLREILGAITRLILGGIPRKIHDAIPGGIGRGKSLRNVLEKSLAKILL